MASVDDLAKLIAHEMEQYSEDVDDIMQKEIDKISKEIVNDLKNNPIIPEKTGDYKKKFYAKKLGQGKGYKRVLIANRKAWLTHLLEHGHAIKTGGRTKEYPHWKNAQEKADTLVDRLKEAIKK